MVIQSGNGIDIFLGAMIYKWTGDPLPWHERPRPLLSMFVAVLRLYLQQPEGVIRPPQKESQQICSHLQFCSVGLFALLTLCLSWHEEARLPFGKGAFECSAGVC
jgi:hypothetical protein